MFLHFFAWYLIASGAKLMLQTHVSWKFVRVVPKEGKAESQVLMAKVKIEPTPLH